MTSSAENLARLHSLVAAFNRHIAPFAPETGCDEFELIALIVLGLPIYCSFKLKSPATWWLKITLEFHSNDHPYNAALGLEIRSKPKTAVPNQKERINETNY